MKVLLVGSQHGNELLGEKLYAYVRTRHDKLMPHIDFVIANPRARRRGVRYLESDMNRSYPVNVQTYEGRQAASLLKMIEHNRYDLVLDLHTTTCQQPPCIIVYHPDDSALRYINISAVEHVVVMPKDIAAPSLIGRCKSAVSIELSAAEVTDQILESLCDDLVNFVAGRRHRHPKQYYGVTGKLYKAEMTERQAAELSNFQQMPDGSYPILVGENSYRRQTDYYGFRAMRITAPQGGLHGLMTTQSTPQVDPAFTPQHKV